MGDCRLLLLGPPQLLKAGQVTRIASRKTTALLAYLAIEQRGFSREYLATLLWPDHSQRSALANLRRILSLLRKTLEKGCLIAEGDQVELDRDSISVDVDEFRFLSTSDSTTPGEHACELYRGSFLEGFSLGDCEEFDEWQDSVRERLQLEFDGLLESLCENLVRDGDARAALPFALRWLELDHLNEVAHRAIMEIHVRTNRIDLARSQYALCSRILAREGLEPSESTKALNDAIGENRLMPMDLSLRVETATTVEPDQVPDEAPPVRLNWPETGGTPNPQAAPASVIQPGVKTRRRGPRLRLMFVLGTVIFCALGVAGLTRWGLWLGIELSVQRVEVQKNGDKLISVDVDLHSRGNPRGPVEYALVFFGNTTIGAEREFVVFSEEIRIPRHETVTVRIDAKTHISEFVDENDVRIPPGSYLVAAVVDPLDQIREDSEPRDPYISPNRQQSFYEFFFAGAAAVEVFQIELAYSGRAPLGKELPLTVYIGDPLEGLENWGRFTVYEEGVHYFPLDLIPQRDNDQSGYAMLLLKERDGVAKLPDHRDGFYPRQGEVMGLFQRTSGNLVYGTFSPSAGTPLYPGDSPRIDFDPPPPPPSDRYERGSKDDLGTLIDMSMLPIRQYRTFHEQDGGVPDEDWLRISLAAGDAVTVETFYAGGRWAVDTQVDVADEQMNYIRSNGDKDRHDLFSRLTYTNDTGIDQTFNFLVKPHLKLGNVPEHRVGEYIVEIRR